MSTSRESVVLVMLANLVLSILVVAGALTIFRGDGQDTGVKPAGGLEERIARLESRPAGVADIEGEVALLDLGNRLASLEARQKDILAKLDALTSGGPGLAPGGGLVGAGESEGSATPKPPEGSEAMMKFVGQMMADRMKRERDRYIEMIQNPTPESEARQERMMRGMARRSAESLGLDEAQAVLLEEIVLEVDKMRRDQFLGLINSKSSPDQITRDEVTRVLDDSFAEEDRRVEQALPADKAGQYKKDASTVRGMMTGMAGSMFGEGGQMK